MNKIHKNSPGFGTVQLTLLLLIVVVISSVGWYVWHTKNQSEHGLKVANSSSIQQKTAADASPINTQQTANNTQPKPLAGTGIKGETIRGAATGCYSPDPNSSCSKPPHVQATIDIQSKSSTDRIGTRVASITSDKNGSFSIDLAPGTYYLVPKILVNGEQASPQNVTVIPGQYNTLMFVYN